MEGVSYVFLEFSITYSKWNCHTRLMCIKIQNEWIMYEIQAVDLKNWAKGSMFGDYYNSLNFVV